MAPDDNSQNPIRESCVPMKSRKAIGVTLAGLMSLSVAACGGGSSATPQSDETLDATGPASASPFVTDSASPETATPPPQVTESPTSAPSASGSTESPAPAESEDSSADSSSSANSNDDSDVTAAAPRSTGSDSDSTSPRSARRHSASTRSGRHATSGRTRSARATSGHTSHSAPASRRHTAQAPAAHSRHTTSASAAPSSAPRTQGATVSATTAVRLRHQPTTSARILDVLYPGDRATVVRGSVDGWTKVTFHGQIGYVASRYLNGAHATAGKPKPAQPSKQVRTVVDKHRTITRNDPTLDWGTTKVETKGVDGRIRITYRNGREVSRQIVVKRVDEVILHGTKDVITTKTVDVPFKTITKDDPNLDWGTSRVETKGVAGKARITYKNGKEIKRETITKPVTQIVYKGSRPVVTTKDVPIDYKTVKRDDPTLDHGKTKVETKGAKGVARVTYRNGKEIKRATITEPVTEVIRVGTKDVVTTKDVKVPFKTITKKDPNLPEGKTKVLTEGRNGVVRITYKNGREIKRETITQPVNKVVAVGTKKKDVITTKTEKIGFDTVLEDDPYMLKGQSKVVQQGREGVERVTYKNGKEVKREVIKEPVDELVRVGTRQKGKPVQKPYITFEKCGTPSSTYEGMVDIAGSIHGAPNSMARFTIWATGTLNGEPWSYTYNNEEVGELGSDGTIGFNHWTFPSVKNLKCHGRAELVNR